VRAPRGAGDAQIVTVIQRRATAKPGDSVYLATDAGNARTVDRANGQRSES
jgi:hypothetical protein